MLREPADDAPKDDPFSPLVGKILRCAREKNDMKQEVVAKKAGMSDKTLRWIEQGKLRVSRKDLAAICPLVKLDPDKVLLEAAAAMWDLQLEKLARDPGERIARSREKLLEAVRARHRAEHEEIEAKLLWDSALFFEAQLVARDGGPADGDDPDEPPPSLS